MLTPPLQVLNAGKGGKGDGQEESFSALKRRRTDAPPVVSVTPEKISAAAAALHAWLSLEKSPLRAILAILGGEGVFFAAHVAERVARGWAGEDFDSTANAVAASATADTSAIAGTRAAAAVAPLLPPLPTTLPPLRFRRCYRYCPSLRHARSRCRWRTWRSRWTTLPPVAVQRALSLTLVDTGTLLLDGVDGVTPDAVEVWLSGAQL